MNGAAEQHRSLKWFVSLIIVLTVISCGISISHNDLYQDGTWANAQWLGQDIITLTVAVPFLLLSFYFGVRKGSLKWILVFVGVLFYFFYTYSFFMFAANLTVLYLFHLPIFGLATISLVITVIFLFNTDSRIQFERPELKWGIAIYLILISLMISALWISDIYLHLTAPDHISGTPDGKPPLIIYSLDLALVIPLMIASAIQLFRKSAWGYLLTGIILTKTSLLGFALMAMAASMYVQELNPEYFLIFLWCIIGLLGTALTYIFMKHLHFIDNSGIA